MSHTGIFRFFTIFFIAFMLAGLSACSKPSQKSGDDKTAAGSRTPAEANAKAESAAAAPAAEVRVEDAGAGEKIKLRYQFKAGESVTARMDMKMSMKMDMGAGQAVAIDMPTIGMKMKIRTLDVLPVGNLKYEFVFDSVEVAHDAQLPDTALESLKDALKSFEGTTGQAEVTPRGVTLKADLQAPQNANPQIRQMMDSLRQQMNQMSVPFPEEPVGAGAHWTVTTRMQANGIAITNIYHYTLEKMENGVLEMKVSLEQKADPQEIKSPGLPPGTVVKLMEMQSGGTGKIRTTLSQLIPESEASSEIQMKMQVQSGAQEQSLSQTMKLGVKMYPEQP